MSNFCFGCGTEIEANNLKDLLIRPFCENCKSDYKLQRFFSLICLGFALLGTIYGFGAYLKKSDKPVNLLTTANVETASNKNRNLQNQSNQQVSRNANVQNSAQKTLTDNAGESTNSPMPVAITKQKTPTSRQNPVENVPITTEEAVYICGAQTQKGTPCLRRVRGGGRCWQHKGQPAILPSEKLLVSR